MAGRLEGELFGKPPGNGSIELDRHGLRRHREAAGRRTLSVASWRCPIAITFQTRSTTNGKIYQLRRLMSVMSPTSFDDRRVLGRRRAVKRLGNGHYTKLDATALFPPRGRKLSIRWLVQWRN